MRVMTNLKEIPLTTNEAALKAKSGGILVWIHDGAATQIKSHNIGMVTGSLYGQTLVSNNLNYATHEKLVKYINLLGTDGEIHYFDTLKEFAQAAIDNNWN